MIKLKLAILGLLLFVGSWAHGEGTSTSTNALPISRKLVLGPSSAPVPGGKANLIVGTLTLGSGAYLGDYDMKVSPFFFESEKGKLSITAPPESVEKLIKGIAVEFTGKATSSGSGRVRRIDGKTTPSGKDGGMVTLWFVAAGRKMIFTTSYQFVEK